MKHTEKVKIARKLMTKEEIANGVSKFDSKAWQERKEAKLLKVISKYMSALGRKGGNILKEQRGSEYYKKISEMGHKAKLEKKLQVNK